MGCKRQKESKVLHETDSVGKAPANRQGFAVTLIPMQQLYPDDPAGAKKA